MQFRGIGIRDRSHQAALLTRTVGDTAVRRMRSDPWLYQD
jgi:hypothetical protein